jgi:glycosyltransferase involved in cell wall biosynthesis
VVQRLVREFPELLFLIAGEGPDQARLRRLVAELGIEANVRFFGNLDRRTTLLDAYKAGDAFVFASPTETQGLVLIEAMALGVPIVSTAVMGTAMVLRDTHSAMIAPENVEAFAEQAAQVLRSPELRARLSAAGPGDARRWSSETLMRQVETLYGSLAQGRAQLVVT